MNRWKQFCICRRCGHSAWREVEYPEWKGNPPLDDLKRRATCTHCKSRAAAVMQVLRPPRHFDQTQPGGMRVGLVDFGSSAERDVEIAEGRRASKAFLLRNGASG